MRLTKKVFSDLAIYMVGFGLLMGIIFPFFMLLLGIPSTYLLTIQFFLSCITAGVIVGAINILLARSVVGRRIRLLLCRMKHIVERLDTAKSLSELEDCASQDSLLPGDSEDELGESARTFNNLVVALSNSISSETAVREFNTMLASQLELESLTKQGLSAIISYIGADAGAIIIERGGEFEVSSSYGLSEPSLLIENTNLWKLAETHQPERTVFDTPVRIDKTLLDFEPKEIITFPILYKDISIGLLVIASKTVIEDRSIQSLELFIQSLALALNNAVTYDQLQKLAANDPLTGLYNRRFGMVRLTEEFNRAVRTKLPIGLIIFDIDHFKKVNDTYGHTIGDRVLVNLAKITPLAVRKGDFSVRYGGEEFVVILPGAGRKDCLFIAERLRHMVEESSVSFGDIKISITISIGAASYPEYHVEDEHELLKSADRALYRAKEQGRNMVVSA